MKAMALYRIASGLLFLATAGSIYGLVQFWRHVGLLNPVLFPSGHSGFSYAQVVLGMEVFCSLCVLFAAYLAWHLGGLARNNPQAIGGVGWVLFAYQLLGVYISWIFLSGFVRVLALALALCVGCAAWLSTAERSASASPSVRTVS